MSLLRGGLRASSWCGLGHCEKSPVGGMCRGPGLPLVLVLPDSLSVFSPQQNPRSLGGDVASDGDFLIFEGNRYSRKGFLFKSFAMSAVVRVLGAQALGEGQGLSFLWFQLLDSESPGLVPGLQS